MHPHKLSASHTLTFLSAHCRLPFSVSGSALLATAESSGSVVLYSVEREMEGAVSVRVAQRCAVVENGLCLSLDWNHCPHEQG